MTHHFLRLKWMSTDQADLLAAYQDGLLEERNWCDLKSSLAFGKGANAELARDLASFSVDGGTLIIGLDEKESRASPSPPQLFPGLGNRDTKKPDTRPRCRAGPLPAIACRTVRPDPATKPLPQRSRPDRGLWRSGL